MTLRHLRGLPQFSGQRTGPACQPNRSGMLQSSTHAKGCRPPADTEPQVLLNYILKATSKFQTLDTHFKQLQIYKQLCFYFQIQLPPGFLQGKLYHIVFCKNPICMLAQRKNTTFCPFAILLPTRVSVKSTVGIHITHATLENNYIIYISK